MNICLLCQSGGRDGWSTYAGTLRLMLEKNGHAVALCSPEKDASVRLPSPLSMLTRPWQRWYAARRAARFLDVFQADVIHIAAEPYALLFPFLPGHWKRRTVMTVHGSYGVRPLEHLLCRPLAKNYYTRIPAFMAVSDYTRRIVTQALETASWHGAAEHFSACAAVVRNGIVLPPFSGAKKSGPLHQVVLVGGVKPRKGVLEAVRGCAEYKRKYGMPLRFLVVGKCDDGSAYARRVRAEIAALGLERDVELAGTVDDAALEKIYGQAGLFLMPALTTPNTFEGFGLAYLEANARGIPAIGPDDSGAAEAVEEGGSGYRVDPADPAQIAGAMHRILDEHAIDPLRCRAWAEAHSAEKQVRAIEAVYTSLAS